jgi:ATP-dependent DNA helicase RecQ
VSQRPPSHHDILGLLKQVFGFSSFRPLQREIIEDALAGRDVFALLPTGAASHFVSSFRHSIQPGLTLVVSPLISLMKDQVDALRASGIEATYLNSSVALGKWRSTPRVSRRALPLVYLAPERLLMPQFLQNCKSAASRCWRLTKRTASANGATIFGLNTASW